MADIAELPKPDGYAYRYPDGYIRHNSGHEVNGGSPTETLPWFYESTVRALFDRLSRELAEAREKASCYEMAAVTGEIDAEIWHQLATKLAKYLETRGVDPYTRHDMFKAVDEIIRQLAESERVSAARNKLNGELAMENERLRRELEAERADANAGRALWAAMVDNRDAWGEYQDMFLTLGLLAPVTIPADTPEDERCQDCYGGECDCYRPTALLSRPTEAKSIDKMADDLLARMQAGKQEEDKP